MDQSITCKKSAFTFSSISISENQMYITAAVVDKDADQLLVCKEIYQETMALLIREKMQIVQERLFGSVNMYADVIAVRKSVMCASGIHEEYPVTFIQGSPVWGEGFAGVQIYAFRPSKPGDETWTIYEKEIPCGRGWKRNGTTYLMFQSLHGLQKDTDDNNRETQTVRMFDRAKILLKEQGVDYRSVIRTWIYISDILNWYGEFNKIRNDKYTEFGIIPTSPNGRTMEQIYLPASTGIEGKNFFGAASVMDVLAIKIAPDSQIEILQNTGSLQRSPYRYGSAFSRSMILREPQFDLHYVSGTASIDEQGKTVYPGDTLEQIQHTFGVVETLIKKEGASLQDICQATVFLKKPEDLSLYHHVIERYGLTGMPAVCVIADICRDDLLFELDAIIAMEKK